MRMAGLSLMWTLVVKCCSHVTTKAQEKSAQLSAHAQKHLKLPFYPK